jgi:hypothetical protein
VTRSMRYLHGFIGLTFVVLALLHVPHPSPYLWAPYAAGAALTFITLFRGYGVFLSYVLAIATTALLFFFFAAFFMEVPKLAADWYKHQEGWAAVSMLFGAFAMLSILSDYTCRCKAEDCVEQRARDVRPTHGFFSAPAEPRRSNL